MENEIKSFHKLDSIILKSNDPSHLKETILNYLKTPKHLIFNFDLLSEPSDEVLDLINFLSTLLQAKSYDLKLFGVSDNVASKFDSHQFRNLKVTDDLNDFITKLDAIERELRLSSILKSYLDNCMTVIFERSNFILKRGELTLEDSPKSFLNPVNYFQTFELEDAFFTFVIGAEEAVFNELLLAMNEKQLSTTFNDIINLIPKELKSDLKIHDYLSHPYSEFPSETITIQGSPYNYFENCGVMRIPVECLGGTFFIEVWVPKKFSVRVYSFLNP